MPGILPSSTKRAEALRAILFTAASPSPFFLRLLPPQKLHLHHTSPLSLLIYSILYLLCSPSIESIGASRFSSLIPCISYSYLISPAMLSSRISRAVSFFTGECRSTRASPSARLTSISLSSSPALLLSLVPLPSESLPHPSGDGTRRKAARRR